MEARDLACVFGAPVAEQHAKPGEIEVGLGGVAPPELEARDVVGETADRAVLDDVDRDRILVDEAAMQGLDHKTTPFGVPDAILPMDVDRLVLLEGEIAQRVRQVGRGRHIGAPRQLAGDLDDRVRVEALSFAEHGTQERRKIGLLRETRRGKLRTGERRTATPR